jgi:Icc-related predicted phosphoesterase
MVILHISDTHGFHEQFPATRFEGVDVVIHSGDCSNIANTTFNALEVLQFIRWYATVPVKHKIYVAGNHDTSIERKMVTQIHFEDAGIIYLENDSVSIDGVNFYGSPHTPTFGTWAFMKARDKLNRVWEAIPEDTDVLIVHGPPKGVRDLSYDRQGNLEMCGCSALMKRCWKLKGTLKLVAFGHIHNMDGIDTNQGVSHYSNTKTVFSNAACVYDGRFDKGLTSFGNIITL